jgi:hypothetical protein
MHQLAVLMFILAGVGACATMKPPATNSGPALSATGVEVAVLRQLCAETQFGTMSNWIDETVELQVRNESPEPVIVRRDRFRLIAPDGGAFSSGAASPDPLTLAKGAAQTFELTFSSRGALACTKAMRLDAGAAITARESPIALRPVSFVPLAAL